MPLKIPKKLVSLFTSNPFAVVLGRNKQIPIESEIQSLTFDSTTNYVTWELAGAHSDSNAKLIWQFQKGSYHVPSGGCKGTTNSVTIFVFGSNKESVVKLAKKKTGKSVKSSLTIPMPICGYPRFENPRNKCFFNITSPAGKFSANIEITNIPELDFENEFQKTFETAENHQSQTRDGWHVGWKLTLSQPSRSLILCEAERTRRESSELAKLRQKLQEDIHL